MGKEGQGSALDPLGPQASDPNFIQDDIAAAIRGTPCDK
jgi:hypothetical protein